ncbi:MAG: maleylpyruvate isomerase family mycothiol-dependent enzyme [Candidatus Promineifilaceae bacterium]|nr:maleylpyruvate isomerase family mycothiol-dependent enzyme [Candidatus Promineifilaceae bacterium]
MSATVVNPMSYEGKSVVLDVVRRERQAFYDIIDDPDNWTVDTRCEGWQVRDIVGHMIDVTEGYLNRWEKARKGEEAEAVGLQVMGERLNEGALSFRTLSREEAINRLKTASEQMMEIFDNLSEDEWNNFHVTHAFMGPLPAFFYPAFHVMDYGVHTWDMRYGLGDKLATLDETTAGVLIPYMFVLMEYTVDADSAAGLDTVYGIEVSGPWGGRWRVRVADGEWKAEPEEGSFDGCEALFSFNPSDFVLSSFQRYPGGAARGDHRVINRVRNLFFTI